MNPAIGAAMAPPVDPTAAPQGQSITLTKMPDGTITCDDGSGAPPSVHNSLDDALNYAKTTLGGDTTPDKSSPAPKDDSADDSDSSDSNY